jgi:hypothetical protein
MTHVLPMPDPPTNRLEFPAFVLPLLNQQLGGQILDENGKPVAGVQLQARAISHVVRPTAGVPDAWDVATISGRYLGFSQTDRDGHFFFDEVCEGPIQLTLSVQGPAILLETTGGTTNILLRLDLTRVNRVIFGNNLPPPLDPVVNITGTVRDPSGAPAAGTTIEWAKHGELPSVNTDSTGRYSIPWLKGANTLSLLARDEQRNLAATNELNSTITNVDLRLNPGLTISVKAQDADGRPIPSATGTLAFKGEYSQWSLSRVPARADEQGRIEFRGLPQGLSYITSVTSRGYSTETAEAPLEATRTNRLELPPAVLRVPDTEPDAGK